MKALRGSCGTQFEAQRSTAKFCGDTCRKRCPSRVEDADRRAWIAVGAGDGRP
jgi:hypothetical protein